VLHSMERPTEMSKSKDDGTPHPLDVALGSRIRLRRRELGLSQDQLARAVGITFQQVQKYEHGTNRVSFSRLVEIAIALHCAATELIGDLDQPGSPSAFNQHVSKLCAPGAAELLDAYAAIGAPKHRRAILNLARQLAEGRAAGMGDIVEEPV
jgi:transcriptional regulator with XRE-family HTH domain